MQDGTAVLANIPGYTVAGKTGTAQVPETTGRGYVPGDWNATFVGFVPAEGPATLGDRRTEPPDADLRWTRVSPGLLPDHALRAPALQHPALAGRSPAQA